MRIFELSAQDFKPKQLKARGMASTYGKEHPKGLEYMGSGIATTVFQKKNKSHEVRKITFSMNRIKNNYLIEFLKICIKHEGNPLLPKIYSIKILKKNVPPYANGRPASENYAIAVETEKLEMDTLLSWGEISYLYRRFFGMSYSIVASKLEYDPKMDDKGLAMSIFSDIFDSYLKGYTFYIDHGIDIVDNLAVKALNEFRILLRNLPESFSDLTRKNILYRRTPYGIWPVLADPIHQSGVLGG